MTPRGARRIWCELCPAQTLIASGALAALAERSIALLFAVGPGESNDALAVVAACRNAGVIVGLWPMLEARRGRWANELTAHALAPFAEGLFERLDREGLLPDELAIDLEPPFELLATPSIRSLARFLAGNRERGTARLVAWRVHAQALGVRVIAAALPTVLADGPRRFWQRILATPVEALGADHVTAMMYSSLIEGYARGRLDRNDARSLVGHAAALAAARPGFGLSLGSIATGSLGDEPVYRSPAELADDVAIARAAGTDDLALFSLCGALRRPPIEPWLDAFVHTEPSVLPPLTARAKLIERIVSLIGA